jgi:hypothetical protein
VAVSGVVSQTVFNTRKVIDHAFRKCRIFPEAVGAEQLEVAQDNLYLLLSSLANRGLQLWCIDKVILPLYVNTAAVPVPLGNQTKGVNDLLNTNFRTIQYLTATETVASDSVTFNFSTSEQVTTVGVLWSGASASYVLETSTNGISWTTVLYVNDPAKTAGQWSWTDIDGALPTQYFRVKTIAGSLLQSEVLVGNTPNEIVMARLNRDSYSTLPNKTFAGKPLQIEVPQRWYEAIVYQLASRLAEDLPQVDPSMVMVLDQKAMRALNEAEMEERDNSPIYFTPNISIYTR